MSSEHIQLTQSPSESPPAGLSLGHRTAMECILDAEQKLGSFVEESYVALSKHIFTQADSLQIDVRDQQVQELVMRIKLGFRQGMSRCILHEERHEERRSSRFSHNSDEELQRPPHHLQAVDLKPFMDTFDWNLKVAGNAFSRGERIHQLSSHDVSSTVASHKAKQLRKGSGSFTNAWHLPFSNSKSSPSQGDTSNLPSSGDLEARGFDQPNKDMKSSNASESSHLFGTSSFTLTSCSNWATSVENLSNVSGGGSQSASQANASGLGSSGNSTGAGHSSNTDDGASGSDSRGSGEGTSDDEANVDSSDLAGSDPKVEKAATTNNIGNSNVRMVDDAKVPETHTLNDARQLWLSQVGETGGVKTLANNRAPRNMLNHSFMEDGVPCPESQHPLQPSLTNRPPSSLKLSGTCIPGYNDHALANSTFSSIQGWNYGMPDLQLLASCEPPAYGAGSDPNRMTPPVMAAHMRQLPRMPGNECHADSLLNLPPGSDLPNIVASLNAQTRQLHQQLLPQSATGDTHLPVGNDIMLPQQPHWDALDPRVAPMQSINFLGNYRPMPAMDTLSAGSLSRESMSACHHLGGRGMNSQQLGSNALLAPGMHDDSANFNIQTGMNGSNGGMNGTNKRLGVHGTGTGMGGAAMNSNNLNNPAYLPERLQKLPLAVRQRILLLIHHNSFLSIKDFDIKVVRKLSLLTTTYGEAECLVALDNLAVRLQSKQQESMTNTAGYLDVAIGSHMEALRAAAKVSSAKSVGSKNGWHGGGSAQQVQQVSQASQVSQAPQCHHLLQQQVPQHVLLNHASLHRLSIPMETAHYTQMNGRPLGQPAGCDMHYSGNGGGITYI